jgi:hypothetical protein
MFTIVEGEWDPIMAVVKQAVEGPGKAWPLPHDQFRAPSRLSGTPVRATWTLCKVVFRIVGVGGTLPACGEVRRASVTVDASPSQVALSARRAGAGRFAFD